MLLVDWLTQLRGQGLIPADLAEQLESNMQ